MDVARKEMVVNATAIFTSTGYGKSSTTNGIRPKNIRAVKNRKARRFWSSFVLSNFGSASIWAVTGMRPKSTRIPAKPRKEITVMYQPNCSVPRYLVIMAMAINPKNVEIAFPIIWTSVFWAILRVVDIFIIKK